MYNEELISKLNNAKMSGNYHILNSFVFAHTLIFCEQNQILSEAINKTIQKEYVIKESDSPIVSYNCNPCMKLAVTNTRTFFEAAKYKGYRTCVLNFANNHSVGGAPYYAGAQEESLCRCSTLYPCLKAKEEEYYSYHIKLFENNLIDYYGNDDLIYSKDIIVFKSDEDAPRLLEESDWYQVDVITCAAPDLPLAYDKTKYKKIIKKRINRILDVAEMEKVEVLILGAWGCGAFHNPPALVAEAFKDAIKGHSFKCVVFAIDNSRNNKNFDVFNELISG